jgi:hypothetical protein
LQNTSLIDTSATSCDVAKADISIRSAHQSAPLAQTPWLRSILPNLADVVQDTRLSLYAAMSPPVASSAAAASSAISTDA